MSNITWLRCWTDWATYDGEWRTAKDAKRIMVNVSFIVMVEPVEHSHGAVVAVTVAHSCDHGIQLYVPGPLGDVLAKIAGDQSVPEQDRSG